MESEPSAALYGLCPNLHPRAVRTTPTDTGTHMDLFCPTCERDGTVGLLEIQAAADYLLHRHDAPRERTLHLTTAGSDPLDLLRDIRIDVSIDGSKVGARAIHLPTGTTVQAPGLGVALTTALRDCVAAVGRLHAPDADGHQQTGDGDD